MRIFFGFSTLAIAAAIVTACGGNDLAGSLNIGSPGTKMVYFEGTLKPKDDENLVLIHRRSRPASAISRCWKFQAAPTSRMSRYQAEAALTKPSVGCLAAS